MPLLTIADLERASSIFRGKFGNALGRGLMKMLAVDKCNNLYDNNYPLKGPEFAKGVLEEIGVRYTVENAELLKQLPEGPFITISNHPYGHIDGIILVDLFGHIRPDYKVMVNKFLGMIEPMQPNFIQVIPTGKEKTNPTADSLKGVKEAIMHIRAGQPLGLFPAGAVSDLSLKDKCVRDRDWQDSIIHLVKKLNVPIVPVTFRDGNSRFYYSLGLIDWKVRLLRLPSEVFNKRGKKVRVKIGEIITPEKQKSITDIQEYKAYLRNSVYSNIK
ncbi:MAG: 1-acyl-sn-glycerol-3-phosphate acyltransferase [Muribaculaceae bacterium]|nr:1-acyl-sn-glycerol-3-phosphate acyltransferase [Muribaculaceae bacterium]